MEIQPSLAKIPGEDAIEPFLPASDGEMCIRDSVMLIIGQIKPLRGTKGAFPSADRVKHSIEMGSYRDQPWEEI